MKHMTLRNFLRLGMAWHRQCVAALCLVTGAGAAAAPPPWPESAYSYFAEASRLEAVLGDFAASFSLVLSIQPGVTGTVNGRFTSASPTEFISRLGAVYGFSWYTQGGVLHVSRTSDAVMRSVPIPAGGAGRLRQALTDLGVVEPKFGWGELPEHGVLMISGPPTYVNSVEAALRQLPVANIVGQEVRVFRLRHASADDRVILYRDRQITQPGLASVLRGLLSSGQAIASVGVVDEKVGNQPAALPAAAALGPAGATGTAGTAGTAPDAPAAATRRGGSSAGGVGPARGATIQSDPRLNALIVTDIPERMSLYERLIAQLDIPSALIEIEAMIIDINTERAREIGINWAARLGGISTSFSVPPLPRFGALTLSAVSGGANASSATLPPDAGNYLIAQIQLLERSGDARIQSRPSVLTTDNIGALLDLSETFYVRVQGERVASVSPITAGTTLKVTPRLVDGADGSIQLTVDIEDGQIQDRQVDSLPTVRRSTVSTQAMVRQNETLMIAGYSTDQSITSDSKVPWLGDLPVVGPLFGSKLRTVQKRERVFLIRPKMVAGAAAAALVVPADPVR